MEKNQQKKMSDSFLIATILALVGGYINCYTYLNRGNVFATAETGNMCLLGMQLAQGNYAQALKYLVPICSFAVGIFIAALIRSKSKLQMVQWRQIILLIEAVILIIVAWIPQGELDVIANVMIAFVSALQFESFKTVEGYAVATVFCTGNLRSMMEFLFNFAHKKDRKYFRQFLIYLGVMISFLVGIFFCVKMTDVLGIKAVLVAIIFQIVAFLLLFFESDPFRKNKVTT